MAAQNSSTRSVSVECAPPRGASGSFSSQRIGYSASGDHLSLSQSPTGCVDGFIAIRTVLILLELAFKSRSRIIYTNLTSKAGSRTFEDGFLRVKECGPWYLEIQRLRNHPR